LISGPIWSSHPVAGLFKWRQFEPEMILLALGWYLRFSLSYRDVEELLAERGLLVDNVTVWRWVQRYAPKIKRRLRPRLPPTNDSWRVDETYIRVKGKWVYLLPRCHSNGATIDFLLSAKSDAAAAERFLAKALDGENHPAPRVIQHRRLSALVAGIGGNAAVLVVGCCRYAADNNVSFSCRCDQIFDSGAGEGGLLR
jgi:transposase-like protein